MPIILGQDPNEAYDVIPWRSIRVARAEDGGWSRAMEYPSVIAYRSGVTWPSATRPIRAIV
jgi:hypothetical protein